jgi:hypothetical protein
MSKPEREYVYITQGCLDARDIKFEGVPVMIEICPLCHANGKRVQYYMEGKMTGPCDFCNAAGFVYKDTARGVPLSVTNQIAVASGVKLQSFFAHGIDWTSDV